MIKTFLKFVIFSIINGAKIPPILDDIEQIAMPLDLRQVGKTSFETQYIIQKTDVTQYLVSINKVLYKMCSLSRKIKIIRQREAKIKKSDIVCRDIGEKDQNNAQK